MSTHREGWTYLQVIRDPQRVGRLSVVGSTKKPPASVVAGAVIVKVKLRVPDAAFAPVEAVVTVPEDLVQRPVEVDAIEGVPI